MSEQPHVQPWQDTGDVLNQGGTVHVSESTKFEQFKESADARPKKSQPRRRS